MRTHGVAALGLQIAQQIIQRCNRADLQAQRLSHVLHRAVGYIAGGSIGLFFGSHLLTVQRNRNRMRDSACSLDEGDGLARSSAGAHHVIHNQDAALEGRTDQ